MAVVVVDEGEGVVVKFGGEAEGVFGEEVTVGDAGGVEGTGDGAEGGVVVVRGDAVLRGVAEYLGEPHKLGADGVAVGGVQSLDAKEVVVNKAEVRGNLPVSCLLIVHAAAKAVEGHCDDRVAELPADGPVFGVVDDRPNASGSFDYCLVAIRVVLRHEVIDGDVGVTFVHIKKSATEEHRR